MKSAYEILKEAKLLSTYWGKRIALAEKKGYFTRHDLVKAAGWVTCACGKITADIPRMDDDHITGNIPLDYELQDLGKVFPSRITMGHFKGAASILVEIEARAIIVAQQNRSV